MSMTLGTVRACPHKPWRRRVLAIAGLVAWLSRPLLSHQDAIVSGVVVVESTDDVVAEASLILNETTGRITSRSSTADAAGRFQFPAVPPGRYYLSASKAPFVATDYGATRPEHMGTPIVVAAGQPLANLRLSMFRGAVVSGSVWSPDGRPVPRANVYAIRHRTLPGGVRVPTILAQGTTDDRGQYRIFGLPPGDYLLRTGPGMRPATPGPPRVLTATYFPGTDQIARAAFVRLETGEERLGADIRLSAVTTAILKGVVRAPSGVDVTFRSLRVSAVPAGDPSAAAWTAATFDGEFVFEELPLGRYRIAVSAFPTSAEPASGPGFAGELHVSITSAHPPPVDVIVQPPTMASGSVEFRRIAARPVPQPDLTTIRVALRFAEGADTGSTRAQGQVAGNGAFVLRGVSPGRYQVDVRSVARGRSPLAWRVQAMRLDDRELTQPIVQVESASTTRLMITLADDTATYSGTLMPGVARPASPFIVLVPLRLLDSLEPAIAMAVRPATDGVFDFVGVRAGEYAVAIVDDIHPDSLNDPDVLERLKAASTQKLSFARGEDKRQDLHRD